MCSSVRCNGRGAEIRIMVGICSRVFDASVKMECWMYITGYNNVCITV